MILKSNELELRGIERKEFESGTYFCFYFEELSGEPVQFYAKNRELTEGKTKGKKYILTLDYKTKYKSMNIEKMEEVK